jgi:hypothetical protein
MGFPLDSEKHENKQSPKVSVIMSRVSTQSYELTYGTIAHHQTHTYHSTIFNIFLIPESS